MYCPVYGCNSDSQIKTDESVNFFRFPCGKTPEQKSHRAVWIEFCKRKAFKPSACTRICSLHFSEEAYEPSHFPQFLKSIGYKEKMSLRLKPDALPTLKKPTVSFGVSNASASSKRTRRQTEKRRQQKNLEEWLKSHSSTDDENSSVASNLSDRDAELRIDSDAVDEEALIASSDVLSNNENIYAPRLRSKCTQTSLKHTQKSRTVKTQTYITTESCFKQLFDTANLSVRAEVTTQNVNNKQDISHTTRLQETQLNTTVNTTKTTLGARHTSTIQELPCSSKRTTSLEPNITIISSHGTEPTLTDEEVESQQDNDEDYEYEHVPSESDSATEEEYEAVGYDLSQGKPPQKQMKFVVFEEAIMQAFATCRHCGSRCTSTLKHTTGSFCSISVSCTDNMAHSFVWSTGPISNNLPVFNLLLAAGILCTGLESTKVLRLFDALNIPIIKYRELSNLMKSYVIPSVYRVWGREQSSQLETIRGKSITVASDMRVDSPGHSGLFGSGSTLDLTRNVVLDTQIIKSTEVKNSNAMELESLKRQIAYLEKNKVKIDKLVTDRHVQVASYMAKEKPQIEHSYDVWHVAKGERKRLTKLVKKKKFQSIKPWIGSIVNHVYWVGSSSTSGDEREEKRRSILNHIVNIHVHSDHKIFTKCVHGTVDRAWLTPGSASHKMLTEMITRPRLIAAIRKLSQYHQTSGLEAKHSLDNLLATKNTYYSYHSLSARLYCSNLHYNENSTRKQATTMDGKLRWSISYPKAFKGEKVIAKPLKEKPTYGYISLIFDDVVYLRNQYPTLGKASAYSKSILPPEPSSLVEKYNEGKERPERDEVIARHHTRFSKPALPALPEESESTQLISCSCKGKCATKACPCKSSGKCTSNCKCSDAKCKNRE